MNKPTNKAKLIKCNTYNQPFIIHKVLLKISKVEKLEQFPNCHICSSKEIKEKGESQHDN